MKSFILAALVAVATANPDHSDHKPANCHGTQDPHCGHAGHDPVEDAFVMTSDDDAKKLHFFDFDNAKMLYKGDWTLYKKSRPHDNDCSIAESDNWKGAQQCVESWECRGARMCERGGWCSGFDGCEGSPLPTQAPGLSYTH